MRLSSLLAVALFAMASASQPAHAQDTAARALQRSVGKPPVSSEQVVVVMRYNVAKGARPDAKATAAAQRMADFISKQPGFIDGQVLRNANAGQQPHFLHVTRWQSFADWERLFTTPAVLEAMERERPNLSATGSVFTPVNIK